MTILRRTLLALGLPVLLVTVWWLVSAGSTDFYRPALSTILAAFAETWTWDRIRADVLPSLGRLAVGYLLAFVAGVALGVLIGSNRHVRAFLEPLLEFLRAIPPPVLVPVFILLSGLGDRTKVLVIAFGCVWPILLNTVEGVRGIDEVLRDTARLYQRVECRSNPHVLCREGSAC